MAQEMVGRLAECDPPEVSIVLHAAAQLSFPRQKMLFEQLLEPLRSQCACWDCGRPGISCNFTSLFRSCYHILCYF